MPPKIRGVANNDMSFVTWGINFLLIWTYLSSMNVRTDQSTSVHYAEGRGCYILESSLHWKGARVMVKS